MTWSIHKTLKQVEQVPTWFSVWLFYTILGLLYWSVKRKEKKKNSSVKYHWQFIWTLLWV